MVCFDWILDEVSLFTFDSPNRPNGELFLQCFHFCTVLVSLLSFVTSHVSLKNSGRTPWNIDYLLAKKPRLFYIISLFCFLVIKY